MEKKTVYILTTVFVYTNTYVFSSYEKAVQFARNLIDEQIENHKRYDKFEALKEVFPEKSYEAYKVLIESDGEVKMGSHGEMKIEAATFIM